MLTNQNISSKEAAVNDGLKQPYPAGTILTWNW